jgi:hypothetical protein
VPDLARVEVLAVCLPVHPWLRHERVEVPIYQSLEVRPLTRKTRLSRGSSKVVWPRDIIM